MRSPWATVLVEMHLALSENKKIITIFGKVQIQEGKGDYTGFVKNINNIVVFDLNGTKSHIVKYYPDYGEVNATAIPNYDFNWYNGVGLVEKVCCRVDINGSEIGQIGASAIKFKPVRVFIARDQ